MKKARQTASHLSDYAQASHETLVHHLIFDHRVPGSEFPMGRMQVKRRHKEAHQVSHDRAST